MLEEEEFLVNTQSPFAVWEPGSVENFQQIHTAGGKFKGPEIMESSQEINRASGYFRGPGNVAHSQLLHTASGIDQLQSFCILH